MSTPDAQNEATPTVTRREIAAMRQANVGMADVRKAVDELFSLSTDFGANHSPLGGQVETLRLGLTSDGDEHLWARTQRAEDKQQRYALLLMPWQRCAAVPHAHAVLMAQRTPIGSATKVVEIPQGDLTAWIRRGGWVVGATRRMDDGEVIAAGENRIFAAETVPIYPSQEQIAEQLGLSVPQVRRAATAAYDVWREALADEGDGT